MCWKSLRDVLYNTPNLWGCNALSIWPVVRSCQRQMLPFWRGRHAAANLAATSGVLPAGLRQIRLPTLRKTTGTRDLLHMYYICTTWRYDSDMLPNSKDSPYSSQSSQLIAEAKLELLSRECRSLQLLLHYR